MSEYCRKCGTHISEDYSDICRNCAEISRLEQELTAHKTNTERLSFLCHKAKYVAPVAGFHQGAHQITITCSHPDTVPADFLRAIDEAMAREKGKQ